MRTLLPVLVATLVSACGSPVPAHTACTISGGAAANTPLTLQVQWSDFCSRQPDDAQCTVTVDGNTLHLDTSATLSLAGNSPGGILPVATCKVPALAPGNYALVPFNQTMDVVASGGATSCTVQ